MDKRITVAFYRTASGAQPVRDWLLELSDQDRRTIGKDIQRLEFEWPVGMPHCRPLGKGLLEVRSRISGGRLGRVIFCVSERRLLLLARLHQEDRKTARQDIDLALRRMQEGLS
jgi:phage-related protein